MFKKLGEVCLENILQILVDKIGDQIVFFPFDLDNHFVTIQVQYVYLPVLDLEFKEKILSWTGT